MVIGHVLSCCQIKSTINDVNWQYGILRFFNENSQLHTIHKIPAKCQTV